MTRAAPLPAVKLLPPEIGSLHLTRPRLMDRLATALERRATIVMAGPGYGKTALLARFLKESGEGSVWYSLDPYDRDPSVFFRYLVQGIREYVPEFGERSQGLWEALRLGPEEPEHLADVFIGDAEESLGGRIVLVLDGMQHLEGAEPCARALRRLLANLPGAIHLMLVGRSLPGLGLEPLPEESAVMLLDGEDLLFTPEETGTLLRDTFGVSAGPKTIERLHARTRGWITALQLLRQTSRLETGVDDLPEALFARSESEIFDSFGEEAFASEPEETRELLLGSCPQAVIDAEVCAEALQGLDVRGILAGLVRRFPFVSALESRNPYFVYDPLFLDFLRRKLRAERGAEEARALDERYGRAFARRASPVRALQHFLAAESPREIAALLQRHGEALVRTGLVGMVREAVLFLAARGVRAPAASALWGEACRLGGAYGAAVCHFDAALAEGGKGATAIAGRTRVMALQGLAYSLLKTGDLARATETAGLALAETEERDSALRARVLNTLALIHYRQDRTAEARALWQEALALARNGRDHHLTLMIAHNLGLPHAVAGDLRRASECFSILTSPENPRLGPEEGAAYLNLARLGVLGGDYGGAASLLASAHEIARKSQLKGLLAGVLEEEGNLCRERGDLEAARERYRRARVLLTELGRLDLLDNLTEEEAILTALRGDHGEAVSLAAAAVERRRAAGDREGTASALLALGEVRLRAGTPGRAAAALAGAAAFYSAKGRAYQECVARLWLALARHRERDRKRALTQALQALEIAARHDYRTAVLKIVAFDKSFRDLLASLAEAPSYLREAPAEGRAADRFAAADLVAAPGLIAAPDAGAADGQDAAADETADLTVRLLGPVEVYRNASRKIPEQAWKIRRALLMFCYLAAARDHRATRSRLADVLWGDVRPSVIERNFHPTISFLRRALNYGHNVPKNFIRCERGAYLLNTVFRYNIDAEAFEERIRAAQRKASIGDAPGALADYEAAFALYRGPLMEEEYDEWIEALRTYYEELYTAALSEAGDLRMQSGDTEAAASCFRTLVERDPIDQQASDRLMRALGALDDRAGIEKELARLRRALAEESISPRPLDKSFRPYDEEPTVAPLHGGDLPHAAETVPPGQPAARRASRRPSEVANS